MTWALAILVLLAAALAFNWWVGRPFPPAPLDEVELESEFYGLCEYALVESCVRLTHRESNVVFEFRKESPNEPRVVLTVRPLDQSGLRLARLADMLTTAGIAGRLSGGGKALDLGLCSATSHEKLAHAARLPARAWSLDPHDIYQCVFEGEKDEDLMRERLDEWLREMRSR